jgi:UDP-N-acetylglucosamine 2-epimerase (non-hydrolysing)
VRAELNLADRDYAVVTLHRPSNVDERDTLARIIHALTKISEQLPVIFPVHPRTRRNLLEFGLAENIERGSARLRLIEPLSYLDFLKLYSGAHLVLTDSGGVQEETTALGIPCLTLRENTERPITVTLGTNQIVGTDPEKITRAAAYALAQPHGVNATRERRLPPLWDGHTADRILNEMINAN